MAEHAIKPTAIQDAELERWLEDETSPDVRELIVEAKVPQRTVRFSGGKPGRELVEVVNAGDPSEREVVLTELYGYLKELLGGSVNLLKSAGAIVVRANRQQLRTITQYPLVKAIRMNRKLRR